MPRTMRTHDDEARSSQSKRSRQYEMVEEAMLLRVHHPFLLWEGCNQDAKSRYNTMLAQLIPRHIYLPCVMDWNVLNQMGYGEFNEVCADDELRTKKIIKFRLCRHACSWTLLEFAKRLELHYSKKIKEKGFDVYFQGGMRSDEHFNAREYWLSISREDNLSLLRSLASTIRNPVLRIIKRKNLLSEEVLNSLSALIYYRALDTTTLRELIGSEGRLILERMGNMEICKRAIKRIAYKQSYQWDRYDGVFEHITGVYNVSLQGAYNPPGYQQQKKKKGAWRNDVK
ncbi:hypothetical protein Tco_0375560 [Tanacetum coccineum]